MATLADRSPLPVLESLAEPVDGGYFVAAYPPFAFWNRPALEHRHRLLHTQPASQQRTPLGLYVHVPFCALRCGYCYCRAYGGRSRREWDRYCAALPAELALYRQTPYFADRNVQFVYFGGGTPSLLPATQIHRLMNSLKRQFPWDHAREVTFECAPRSINAEKLAVLRDHGVSRISLGVQQFDDRVLRQNGRIHLVRDVLRAYESIRRIGFRTLNVDLIVGLLGETDETFFASLDQTIGLAPDSVTIYQLEIPHNTPLYQSLRAGTLACPPASWTLKRDRLRAAFATLQFAGYQLRSAYTAVKDPNRHTFDYQDQQYRGCDLLGIGTSSFSYLGGIHFQNLPDVDPYEQAVASGERPLFRAYALSADEQSVRGFVLQLKLGRANREHFVAKFGVNPVDRFQAPLEAAIERGWLALDDGHIVVTREGLLRVDRILRLFYLPVHRSSDPHFCSPPS
jgi:oxygen-independent coproporphyrinogen-3 oxidase